MGEEKILLVAFVTSFIIVLLSTPALIKVADLKRLYDEPGEPRKQHKVNIPAIGGIIIFAATLFSFSLWFPDNAGVEGLKYVVCTFLILFFIGIKDDIVGTAPVKKLMGHILVGLILVLMANIRLTSLHGIFGVREIPEWASVFLSLFTYIVVVNAFNLIDGVDGLASGIGLIASLAFGFWFFLVGDFVSACLAFSLAGSLLAFLVFNFPPAKIFMGDSGALVIGLIMSILAIRLIEFPKEELPEIIKGISKPVYALAVLAFPLFDTLRIFIRRTIKGESPFAPDNKHLHHRMLKIGLSHTQTTLLFYVSNVFVILLAIYLKDVKPSYALLAIAGTVVFLGQIPFFLNKKNES
jgi:UDP-N-acetylmuramyl pentapeptide phosphotransferase/UDP-N-acetylglucosamine-1-phosphate transferase